MPIILQNPIKTLSASQILKNKNYLITTIQPPTIPNKTTQLHFTFTTTHKNTKIQHLTKIIKTHLINS